MKLFIIVSILFISFSSNYAYAGTPGLGTSLNTTMTVPHNVVTKGLVIFYNKLIVTFKTTIVNMSKKVEDPLLDLLTTFAFGSIVFMVGKSFITGESLSQQLIFKLALFLALGLLLRADVFETFVLGNLVMLFDNLPTIFSNTQVGNVMENIISQAGNMIDTIKQQADSQSWGWGFIQKICAGIAIATIISMLLIVIGNVLECSFYFYVTVGMGSIFILLFFFKATRNYSMGAINLIVACILNLIILSFFLLVIGTITNELLQFNGAFDLITNCIIIIITCLLSDLLLLKIKTITETITTQGISTSAPSISSIKDRFTKFLK